MRFKALLTAAALAALPWTFARGQDAVVVSHLNLVSDKSEDVSSLEAWKKTYIKDGMSDQEKAIAIFNTLTRYRHQADPPCEGLNGSPEAGGHVHDPLKSIHVYGYGQCCCASAEVEALARYLGLQARGRDITAHSVAEVKYNDAWHLVDCSVMNYHINDKGELASVDQIHDAITSWLKDKPQLMNDKGAPDDKKLRAFAKNEGWKKGPELLSKSDAFYGKDGVNTAGWHGWPSTMQEYFKIVGEQEFSPTTGYEPNVQLRPGEKITRNFFSRGIEYTNSMAENYYEELQTRKSLGIQTKLGDAAPGRVGDGTIEWNVPRNQLQKVALSSDDSGFVLRFPSSYVYVKGGVTVKTTGAVTVSFSDNNGLDWKPLSKIESAGEQKIDLTALVKRRYDFRLKFEPAGGAKVEAIRSSLDFQCSQAALPVITEGENKLKFSAGSAEGTISIEGSANADEANELGQLTIADYKPQMNGIGQNLAVGDSGSGDITFDVATPGEMTRLRMSTVWRARDAADGFTISTGTDGGKTFTPVPDGKLEGNTKGSGRSFTVPVAPGTKAAKVKIAGTQKNTAVLWNLQICADYKEPAGAFQPVKITYTWDEAGQTKTDEHIAKAANDAYTITCGPKALVKSFTMELAE